VGEHLVVVVARDDAELIEIGGIISAFGLRTTAIPPPGIGRP
jgi:hypothetical protein